MAAVTDFTRKDYILQLDVDNKFTAIETLARVFEDSEVCDDVNVLIDALIDREEIMSTGIGFGIAIPHAKINAVKQMGFAIGISRKGIDFDSMDGQLVHLIFLVAAGEKQHKEYLRLMSNIMSILKDEKIKEQLISSESPEKLLDILASKGGEMH